MSDNNGTFLTRLIIPATNFTTAFSRIGYIGVQELFRKENINYTHKTIIQASDLKEKVEKLELNANDMTIVSLDVVSMYPSITF